MKKKVFFFSTIIFLTFINLYSQNSIKNVSDSISKYLFNDPKKAKFFSHKLLSIAKLEKNDREVSQAYFFLADLSGTISQKDSAFYYYDKAIQKAIEIKARDLELYHKVNRSGYLFSEFDFDGALSSYNECLVIAKELNDKNTYDYVVTSKGGIFYELGKYNEALAIFNERLKKKSLDVLSDLSLKLSLSKVYLKLDQPDVALSYVNKGVKDSHKNNLDEYEMHFLNQKGLILIYKNDYKSAKEAFDLALGLSKKAGIVEMTKAIQINTSKVFTFQKQYEKAIKLLEDVANEKGELVISNILLAEDYYLLAENLKAINSFEKSNIYFQKYIELQKKLGQKKIETIDHLHKYKVSEIEAQKQDLETQKWSLVIALFLLFAIVVWYYFRRKKNDKQNQEKFDFLIRKINDYEKEVKNEKPLENHINPVAITSLEDEPTTVEEVIRNQKIDEPILDSEDEEEYVDYEEVFEEDTSNNAFIIKDEKVNEILEKLIKLEEKQYFLKQECTLHSVAKKLKTNTAYLSKIVNNELGKSFSTYINELRINYIIIELKNNAKLRSYSVNAIAIEIGYKRPEAFTKYFKEATGISPTIYIKKINKMLEK